MEKVTLSQRIGEFLVGLALLGHVVMAIVVALKLFVQLV